MANGHVEIHDPFNDQHGIKNGTESKMSTSSSSSTEDMVEFRILMAYAQRRRPKQTTGDLEQDEASTPKDKDASGSPSTQSEDITVDKKKKKKKKLWKRIPKVLMCLKPQPKDEISSLCDGDEHTDKIVFRSGWEEDKDLENVASRLAGISAEVPFVPPELECDAPDDEVEKVIGLLLRDAGDRLYERELKDTTITDLLGNYNFFERVILSLLSRMGLSTNAESLGPKVSPKTQIAVACEATTRLSVLDTLPMNRLLGNGARFLKNHFSSWAEEQGGYEKAFDSEEDEEVH